MDTNLREILVLISLFILALATGIIAENIYNQDNQPQLYQSSFNKTLNPDVRNLQVNFDNNSLNLTYENWQEFKAYIETEYGQRKLDITSNGETNKLKEVVVLNRKAYTLYFEYRDDPEVSEGDYLILYRIEQIQ